MVIDGKWTIDAFTTMLSQASVDLNGDSKVNSADAIYLLRHTIMPGIYPLA